MPTSKTSSEAGPTLRAGDRVTGLAGAWTVQAPLGAGGFGEAFAAVADDGTEVVLKRLRLDRMTQWKALELFEREAQTLASLSHPAVPRCHDFFATDGTQTVPAGRISQLTGASTLVMVQDRVAGRSLQARVDAGERLTAAQAHAMLDTLLGVLQYLHGLHPPVIHRDIKPANIVVDDAGRAHLVDFGAIADPTRGESTLGSTTVGTFGFFPIEQMLGKAQPASDLYSLGMTMMVALTHRPPESLPLHEATSKVRVRVACPGLPDPLARTLEGMLEPAIGDRIPTATAARAALAGQALAVRTPATPAPVPRSLSVWVHRVPLAVGGLSALALYGVLFDAFSETELVRLSFLWLPVVAFGLGVQRHDSVLGGVTWATVGSLLLGVFIYGIFPAL